MTIGDLVEVPAEIEHTDQGPTVIEVGDARWRQLSSRDNEPVWWEGVQRYHPPTDAITLRRGMMFIDPAGRAIEYMGQLDDTQVSVRVWRNTATDTTTQWRQGTVLTPASQLDLGGAAGLHILPVRDIIRLLRILYIVDGHKVVIEGVSRIDLELPKNLSPTPPGSGHCRKYLKNTECRKTRCASQTDHG